MGIYELFRRVEACVCVRVTEIRSAKLVVSSIMCTLSVSFRN